MFTLWTSMSPRKSLQKLKFLEWWPKLAQSPSQLPKYLFNNSMTQKLMSGQLASSSIWCLAANNHFLVIIMQKSSTLLPHQSLTWKRSTSRLFLKKLETSLWRCLIKILNRDQMPLNVFSIPGCAKSSRGILSFRICWKIEGVISFLIGLQKNFSTDRVWEFRVNWAYHKPCLYKISLVIS